MRNYTKRTNSKLFTTVPLELLTCNSVTIKDTGVDIIITDLVKIVYVYMRNKYCLMKDYDQCYFESWDSIANALGKTRDVFKNRSKNRPDKILQEIGLLKLIKTKGKRSVEKIVLDIEDIRDKVIFNSGIVYKDYNKIKPVIKKDVKETIVEKEVVVECYDPLSDELYDGLPPF